MKKEQAKKIDNIKSVTTGNAPTGDGLSEEAKGELATALFQVHGLAGLLEATSENYECVGGLIALDKDVSDPLLTLSQLIQEKTAFCLKTMGCI